MTHQGKYVECQPNGGFREKNTCVRPTTFGRSRESKTQIADAAKIASGAEVGEILNVYRLVPVAPPFDALTIDSSNKMRTNADKKDAVSHGMAEEIPIGETSC